DAAGSGYPIRATSNGSIGAITPPFTVTNPADKLEVTVPPPSAITTGGTFGLAVSVEDAFGFLATGYNGSVTIALAGKHGGRKLHGTLTVNAVNGVATFSRLTLARARKGQTFQIQATASRLPATTTSPINVSAAPARIPHLSRGRNTKVRA